jgi:hypothetical protein
MGSDMRKYISIDVLQSPRLHGKTIRDNFGGEGMRTCWEYDFAD